MRRVLTVLALAAAMLNPTPARADCPLIVTVGTSIEAGVQVQAGEAWRDVLARRVGCEILDRSLGGGRYTADDANGDNIRKHIDAAIAEFADHPGPKVMILGGPVNDLVSNEDAGTTRWAVHYADAAAREAGWRVVGQAILPFTDGIGYAFPSGWWPNLEQRRQQYNQWGALHFVGRWTDPSWLLCETGSQRGDRRWFNDGLHPHRLGHAVIGEAFPLNLLEGP